MMHILHSLRFQLTALNLLVFGLIQAGSFTAILTLREKEVREDFDEWLRADASRMMEQVLRQPMETLGPSPDSPTPHMSPFHFRGYYFQLRRADRTTLVKSANLEETDLPFGDAEQRASAPGETVVETISGQALKSVSGATGDVRLLTMFGRTPSGVSLCLQLAARMDRVDAAVADLRRLFLAMFPVSLAAVAIASWFMARRALRPIDHITNAVRQLTVDRLGQRLGPPAPKGDLAQMVVSLNEMLDRIEKGFHSHERFVAEVSHELKTPISVLLGEAQLLSRDTRTVEEYDHFVANVEVEMRRLGQTVESLLLLARANAGFPIALAGQVSLNDVVTEAVRRCGAVAAHWEIDLVPRLFLPRAEESEPMVRGDEELLCAMLTNLILNAIRHSPVGQRVTIGLTADGNHSRIAVHDCGPGIAPESVGQLFRPFTSVERDGGPPRGIGLGLVIVKSIAELHRGSVTVSSPSGGGCEVVICLPRSPEE
jgi:two-component system heavy metal sensor histidine kinase CusS